MENRKLVRQYLTSIPRNLKPFLPCAKASDRTAWGAISDELKIATVARAEMLCRKLQWDTLLASDFLDFSRTGNRINFEKKYFRRRNMLNTLVIAECVEAKGRFLGDIIDGMYLILSEAAWNLPAHNSYIRNSEQLPLPDTANPVLDLFACETGAQLAMAMYLLEDELNAVSPFIVQSVQKAIAERVMKPYLSTHFWWMGDGDEEMCNWTPWCTMNVLLCASILHYNELAVLKKAAHSLDCFLKDYGEDGCCNEGVQYYRAAGLCLVDSLKIMNCIASDAFSPLWKNKKIKNIASFARFMHVGGKYYINFGDCSAVAGKSGVREFIAGKLVGDSELMKFAQSEWRASSMSEKLREVDPTTTDGINLYYRVLSLFTAKEIEAYAAAGEESAKKKHKKYYESTGIAVFRNDLAVLAAKMGGNADSHNHNDTGSFTFFAHGEPIFIDLGVETYSKKTFSADRYSIWTMQSSFHNLPDINSSAQHDGKEFCARNVAISDSSIKGDIASAYPLSAAIKSYVREISLLADGFRLVDTFDEGADVWLNLMTAKEPKADGKKLLIGEAEVDITESNEVQIEAIAIKDERLASAWGEKVFRIRLHAAKGGIALRCRL